MHEFAHLPLSNVTNVTLSEQRDYGWTKASLTWLSRNWKERQKKNSQDQMEGEGQVIAWCVIIITLKNNAFGNTWKSTKKQVSLCRVMFSSWNTCASTGHFVVSFVVPGQIWLVEKQAKCSEVNEQWLKEPRSPNLGLWSLHMTQTSRDWSCDVCKLPY